MKTYFHLYTVGLVIFKTALASHQSFEDLYIKSYMHSCEMGGGRGKNKGVISHFWYLMSPEISQTCMTKSDQTVFFFPRYHGEVGFLCLKFQFYHSPLVVGESSETARAVAWQSLFLETWVKEMQKNDDVSTGSINRKPFGVCVCVYVVCVWSTNVLA